MPPPVLVLVGPRASGKSTLARLVAAARPEAAGVPAVDTDDELARRVGAPSAGAYLAEAGEPRFREVEQAVCLDVLRAAAPGAVVALGGGSVLSASVRELLRSARYFVVRLVASPERLWRRISASATPRPALTELSGREEVERLVVEREPHYAAVADFVLQAEDESADAVTGYVAAVLAALAGRSSA